MIYKTKLKIKIPEKNGKYCVISDEKTPYSNRNIKYLELDKNQLKDFFKNNTFIGMINDYPMFKIKIKKIENILKHWIKEEEKENFSDSR